MTALNVAPCLLLQVIASKCTSITTLSQPHRRMLTHFGFRRLPVLSMLATHTLGLSKIAPKCSRMLKLTATTRDREFEP